ncbi:hypothetical protein CMI37_26875 [Candidatus Pacearchaeota archaeon]|nr:hypothetical protein [Candidatus Pacearchaeota archaeon]|tara:strand:+ start:952 stop:1809 length:858 start_codon:yes stop_codon:yes gene_type:complete
MHLKIELPNNDDILENIQALIPALSKMEECSNGKILLDLSDTSWMPPCCIILLSNKVLELRERGIVFDWIPPENEKVNLHLRKLGFPLGSKVDGDSYVPITHIIYDKSDRKKLGKAISDLLNKLIEKIPNNLNGVSYILGELSDNIEDHSEFNCASIMAQYFPQKREIEIIVFDDGLTIPGVFVKNNVSFNRDSEAIEKAVSGEISTKGISEKEEGRGYGLRTCRKLSVEDFMGEIYIFSRKGNVISKYNQESIVGDIEEELDGTLLCVKIKLPLEEIDFYRSVE